MKKKQQLAMIGAAILALFLFRKGGGTNPPPPLECPSGYASDGSKCVPQTPPLLTSGFRLSLNPSNVTTVDFRLGFRIFVPQGFTGCFIFHARLTANNQEVVYETWTRDLSNFGGGYLDQSIRIVLPTPQTTYNVFGYITDCGLTQKYTPIAFTQVRSS